MDLYTTLSSSSSSSSSSSLGQQNSSLFLIELNNDILNSTPENQTFYLKSIHNDSTPVLITDTKTFKIKFKNQSNCLLLLNKNVAYKNFSNQLILNQTNGQVDLKNIKHLKNLNQLLQLADDGIDNDYNLTKFFNDSIISLQEFDQKLIDLNIVEIFNNCFMIDNNLLIYLINLIIIELLDNSSMNHIQLVEKLKLNLNDKLKLNENQEISKHLETVLLFCIKKFFENGKKDADETLFCINDQLILRLISLQILKKEKKIKYDDLLIKIKLNLPINYNPDIEISKILRGFFYTIDDGNYTGSNEDMNKWIIYLDKDSLNTDPTIRFKQLFKLKSEWELHEIEPFVIAINNKNIKLEKFLLKYCKVKKFNKLTKVYKR